MKKLIVLLLAPWPLLAQVITPLSVKQSQFQWEGRPLVGSGLTGTIQFKYGTLTTDAEGVITKGEFVLDMHSIRNVDIRDEQAARDLEAHLKDDDFFSVSKFPTATFVITSVTPLLAFPQQDRFLVKGKLTMKGITHALEFPATLTREGNSIRAAAKVTINRTWWDVNYQSKAIFASLKDGIISDYVDITLQLFFDGC